LIRTIQTSITRWLLYGLWIATSFAIFWRPFRSLVHFALENDDASHILLIPFLSAWILFTERKNIFQIVSYDFTAAVFFLLPALFSYGWIHGSATSWSLENWLAGCTLALVFLLIAGFALIFGRKALRNGRFSFLILFLAVPLSDFLLHRIVYFLQRGSAEITAVLFDVVGVPYLRDGFVFHLARANIEVAHECSGIRSSMALFILALLVGHFALRSFWRQFALVLLGLLVMIVKNGVRIATLTLLANYVDPGFLFGKLHRAGGVVFFLFGLILLVPCLWFLQRSERINTKALRIPPLQSADKPDGG
jgi:exosortase